MEHRAKVMPLILVLCCASSYLTAQTPFQKLYGTPLNEWGISMCRSYDGGYMIAGHITTGPEGMQDVVVTNVSASGSLIWTKAYGGPLLDGLSSIMQTPDSSYLLLGYTTDPGDGWDLWIWKIGLDGSLIWSKQYGGPGDDVSYGIHPHPDGGYLVVGSGLSYGYGGWDGWCFRIDDSGSVIWFRTFGSVSTEQLYDAVPTRDGGFAITGHSYYYGIGMHDVTLTKIGRDGTFQWMKTYGTYADDGGGVLKETADGGFLLSGNTHAGGTGLVDPLIIRTDSLGNLLWSYTLGTAGDDRLSRKVHGDPGLLTLVGWMQEPTGSDDAWLVMLDDNGELALSTRYGGSGTEKFWGGLQEPDGSFMLTGYSSSPPARSEDVLLIRTEALGALPAGSSPGVVQPVPIALGVTSPTPELNSYQVTATTGPTTVHVVPFTESFLVDPTHPHVFVPRVYGQATDTVSIPVKLRYPLGVAGGDISVAVDTSMLVPLSVRKGNLTQDFALAFNLSRPDSIRVSLARAYGIDDRTEGSLFILDCAVRPGVPDSLTSAIGLPAVRLYDQHSNLLENTVEGGEFWTGWGRKGDINADNSVNSADAIACLQIAAGFEFHDARGRWSADVDSDGDITTLDAANILRESVGLPHIPRNGTNQKVIHVNLHSLNGTAGSAVPMYVTISGLPDLVSGTLDLRFDRSLLGVTSVAPSPQFDGVVAHDDTQGDDLRVAFAASSPWGMTSAVLARVSYTALSHVTEYTPSLQKAEFFDRFGQRYDTFQLFVTDVEEPSEVVRTFALNQNYPNPFNPSTTIGFDLPTEAVVQLAVYDLLGREVRALLEGPMGPGHHSIQFNAEDLPSGVYYAVLSAGDLTQRRAMLLMK